MMSSVPDNSCQKDIVRKPSSDTNEQQSTKIKGLSNSNTEKTSSIYPTDEEGQKEDKVDSSSTNYYEELCAQLGISIPTVASFLMNRIPWLISIHFAGSLGSLELAAVSLASTICNVTGMSLCVGMSSALSTLTGQARGDLMLQAERRRQEENNKNIILVAIGYSDAANTNDESKEYLSNESKPLVHLKLDPEDVGFTYGSTKIRKSNDKKMTIETKSSPTRWNDSNLAKINPKISQNFNFVENQVRRNDYDSDEDDIPDPPLMPLTYLFRGIFIQMLFVFPIGIWWLHGVKPMLLYLGQGETIANMATVYLKILTPGLWLYSINFTLNSWLQSIEMAHVPAYCAIFGLILHVPMNILFVRILNFGYIGVGLATIVFQFLQPTLICLYIFGTQKGRDEVLGKIGGKGIGRTHLSFWPEAYAAVSSFSGICQYLSLALPGVIVISEWWASEVTIFFSGRLQPNPAHALGAMAIYQSINSCCFMFSAGTSVAVSARVGTWLGKDNPNRAALSSKIGLFCACFLTLVLSSVLFFTPHTFFPSFFTPDEDVIYETSRTIPLLAIYVFADGLQTTFNGIIKGCGRQVVTIPIVIVAYWVVGVPLSYYLAFILHNGEMCNDSMGCGIVALVEGMTVGTWIHFLLIAMVVVSTTNWKEEVLNAQKRLSLERKLNC